MTDKSPEVNLVEHDVLWSIAQRARVAHDNRLPLEVSPYEMTVLRKYADDPDDEKWGKALRVAFKHALPHVLAPMPWDPPGVTAFNSLSVVVRS